jgi:hypothetical protein
VEILAALTLLLFAILGTLPAWSYSTRWGYVPSGTLGAVVIAVVAMILTGRL